MSTSLKHREFISEPMGDKEVTAIAGIGPTYGSKLTEKGYDKAYIVFGQFLLLKKAEEEFVSWLIEDVGMNNKRYAKTALDCLNEWAGHHI